MTKQAGRNNREKRLKEGKFTFYETFSFPWHRWILKSLLRIPETIPGSISAPLSFSFLRDCLHGGGGPQVGEVTCYGGVTDLSI